MQGTHIVDNVGYINNDQYAVVNGMYVKSEEQRRCTELQYDVKNEHSRTNLLFENKNHITLTNLNYSSDSRTVTDCTNTKNHLRHVDLQPNVLYEEIGSDTNNAVKKKSSNLGMILKNERIKKDRKVLHPQAKEIILNVVNFMKQEAQGSFVIPARRVQCRAATATGFSERTVRRVVKESKSLPATETVNGKSMVFTFPPKKVANRPKPKTGLDAFTRCIVRKMIHKIYVNEKTVPTIKKIHQKLIDEIGFKGGSRSAHKIVKELGFYWKKTSAKGFVLMEKHEIRLKRIEYLRDMARYRHDGRQVMYVAESSVPCKGNSEFLTAIIAGSDRGLIPGPLFWLENTTDLVPHATCWVRDSLLSALPPCSVVVLDGLAFAASHDRVPTMDCDAETMKLWLNSKGIEYRADMLRPELHQVIRRNASRIRKNKTVVEQILMDAGHTVLRIPPDHPDLNPAAMIWADVRRAVAERNVANPSEMRNLVDVRLAELGVEAWANRCGYVRKVEQQYLGSEGIVDAEVERFLAAGKEQEIDQEDPHDNINFVQHFTGGLLGLDEHKLYAT